MTLRPEDQAIVDAIPEEVLYADIYVQDVIAALHAAAEREEKAFLCALEAQAELAALREQETHERQTLNDINDRLMREKWGVENELTALRANLERADTTIQKAAMSL